MKGLTAIILKDAPDEKDLPQMERREGQDWIGPVSYTHLPAPLNLTTYLNSSSASARAGNEPPSRRGRIDLVTFAGRKSCLLYTAYS